jgi:hypothetical protein
VTFQQYFEEKFAFTGSGSKAIEGEKWATTDGSWWTYGFVYNVKDKTVGPHPGSLADLPDEYFVTHDVYSITLEKTYSKDPSSPIHNIAKSYPDIVKTEPYFWTSFESYDWGSKSISSQSPQSRRPARLILQTVIAALDLKVKPSDNICFSAAQNDTSRVSLYKVLANQYADQHGKQVITKSYKTNSEDSEPEVYFFVQ